MRRITAIAICLLLLSGCGSPSQPQSDINAFVPTIESSKSVTGGPTIGAEPSSTEQGTPLPEKWPDEIEQAVTTALARRTSQSGSSTTDPLSPQQRARLEEQLDAALTSSTPFSQASNLLNKDSDWIFVLSAFDQPQDVAQLLMESGQDRNLLLSLLSLQSSKVAREQCLDAWRLHRNEIRLLWERGFYGAETLFLFPRSVAHAEADREYDAWLTSLFSPQGSSADLVQRVYMVVRHGTTIRGLLWQNKDSFRARFRRELWPAMERIFRQTERPMALYMEQPETVWKVVSMPHGEELLRRYGMIPCVLFFGKHRYPEDLQPEVERLLLSGYATAVEAVCDDRLRRSDQFHRFLREKPLQPTERSVAFKELLESGDRYPALLEEFRSISVADLEKRFKPKKDLEYWDDSLPSYLKVSKRWLLGQEFDPGDTRHLWTDVAVHSTSIAVGVGVMMLGGDPFSSGGTAGEAVRSGIGAVSDAMHESIDKDVADQMERLVKQRADTFEKIRELTIADSESMLRKSMEEVATLSTLAELNVLEHKNPKTMEMVAAFHGGNPLCAGSVSLAKDRKLYFQMRPSMRLTLSWKPLGSRTELSSDDGVTTVLKETQLGVPKEMVDWWLEQLIVGKP